MFWNQSKSAMMLLEFEQQQKLLRIKFVWFDYYFEIIRKHCKNNSN